MNVVRHRRNHVFTALGLLVASGLIAFGAFQPVITVSGPDWSLELAKGIGIGIDPSLSTGVDESSQGILVAASVGIAFMGLLLLVTRVRYLGLLWRSIALASLAVPAILVFLWWGFISDPVAVLQPEEPSLTSQIIGGAASVLEPLGLVQVTAGRGLLLIAAGTGTGLLACLIPAIRSSQVQGYGATPASAPPGWYVNPNDARFVSYWDGQGWTASQQRGAQRPAADGASGPRVEGSWPADPSNFR